MAANIICEVPSSSNPAKTYKISYDPDTKLYACTCMDFLTRRRFKGEDCKHITAVKKSEEEALK